MFHSKHVVLLKSGSKNRGGLEKYAAKIASAFVARGANVTYLSSGALPPPLPGVHFHSFPIHNTLSFLKLKQFDLAVEKWIQTHRADLIFGLDRNQTQTHLRAGNGVHAAFLKSRIFTDGQLKYYLSKVNPLHRTILSLEKKAYTNPKLQKIFTNSQMVRKELIDHYPIDSAKIEVVYNGVEWAEMESSFRRWPEAREEAFATYRLDPNLFHIIFIGHGYLRKGLDPLLKALSQWKFRDFHLSIIGNDKNLESYTKKVSRFNMNNQVRFFGSQPNTISFYQFADTLVIPSFYDPFANVTIEALAMGLFVVSSRYNGGHEILTKTNGAIIENLLDPESILEALNQALIHKKTLAGSLKIRQSVSHLDFSHQLTQLLDGCG